MFFYVNFKYLLEKKSNNKLTEFSKQTSIPYRTIQDINSKKTNNPSLDTAYKICKTFNLTINELVEQDLNN